MDGAEFSFVCLSSFVFLVSSQFWICSAHQILIACPKIHRNKIDHLVLGPAAGQGLHNRLQCQDAEVDMVTVGNASYSKTGRLMAVLNVLINFIQVI